PRGFPDSRLGGEPIRPECNAAILFAGAANLVEDVLLVQFCCTDVVNEQPHSVDRLDFADIYSSSPSSLVPFGASSLSAPQSRCAALQKPAGRDGFIPTRFPLTEMWWVTNQ